MIRRYHPVPSGAFLRILAPSKLSLCSSRLLEVIIIIIILNLHGLFHGFELQPLYMITCSGLCFNGTSQVLE